MAKIKNFIKQEKILSIAFIAAIISSVFVLPDRKYLSYIDVRTLALLYCLMVVVGGIRKAGTFSRLAHVLCIKATNTRLLSLILIALSFFSALFITNDVALLTFVPFSVAVLGMAGHEDKLIKVVVLQTVAANLGSMLTPVGNPQNIYIQSFYNFSSFDFIKITFPVWIVSLLLILILIFTIPNSKLDIYLGEKPILRLPKLLVYGLLFIICLLAVLRLIQWYIMMIIVVSVIFFYDRKTLTDADFMLLLTFVCFFVFSGNLARIDYVNTTLQKIITNREYVIGLITSQVISNVPAALLLSSFTDNGKALLLGVNIGGLGTPIASLASLISIKLYSYSNHSDIKQFIKYFSIINILLLAILSLLVYFI